MAQAKLYSGAVSERTGRYARRVTETYAVSNESAAGLENSLWDRPHPKYPGPNGPRCLRIRQEENWLPGITRLTAQYLPVSARRRRVGKARITLKLGSKAERKMEDLSASPLQLEGPIRTKDATDGLNYVKITKGSNIVPVGTAIIELTTAYERSAFSALDIAKVMALIGRVNSHLLPNFGNFPPETLLLLGAPTTHVWDQDALWYVNYAFGVELRGWNKITKRQVVCKVPRELAPLNADNEPTGDKPRHIMVEISKRIVAIEGEGVPKFADAPTEEESTILFEKASFAELDAMVEW